MKRKKISIALQGGGAHGAFTWGIMEKLLEEGVLDIRGLCGTSVGAVHATLIVHGLQRNGEQGAIELMEKFWKNVSMMSRFVLPQPTWIDNNVFNGNMDFSPMFQGFNFMINHFSPYQFNPMNLNALKDVMENLVDFKELGKSKVKLFIAATKVKNGALKVFALPEITVDAILASGCLPFLSQAILVNGEYYWDGGYTGNPPIYPLIYGTDANDILLLQINPMKTQKVPVGITDIADRINEISFNSALMSEMRMITRGYDLQGQLKDIYFQMIPSDDALGDLNFSSKLNTSWEFLSRLRKSGRAAAEKWIRNDLQLVGKETSPVIKEIFGLAEDSWMHEMVAKPARHLEEHPIEKGNSDVSKVAQK